ncbi:MAG: multicopper oxidase domain-containing protein [Anaerolineae bacterium]|nr:multicopper oxidase domain-containing protein [Anaerolineae bacterium]
MKNHMNRREFLHLTGVVFGGLLLTGAAGTFLNGCAPLTTRPIPVDSPVDLEFSLRAISSEVQMLPGRPTRVWRYEGELLRGDPNAMQVLPNSYLGPIFRVKKGQRVRIFFTNELPEATVVHWHGLHLPDTMDGHPRFAMGSGEKFTYEFEIMNRAGTYWYHPHPHGQTGAQVYAGLAGLFIVSDEEEASVGLPEGKYDLPLVIQDRIFADDDQLVYQSGGMMNVMMGFLGDRILVNGRPDYSLSVDAHPYRLRLLNGSNSRIYKLAWSDGTPLTVIGTDGGLIEKPVQRDYVMLAPAERIELWADFGQYSPGTTLTLKSLEFSGTDSEQMMMMNSTPLPNGAEFDILQVRVDRAAEEPNLQLPEILSGSHSFSLRDAVNVAKTRSFVLEFKRMNWTINGRTFDMKAVADDEKVKLGESELWLITNQPGTMMHGGMMGGSMSEEMAHPIHIHGLQFLILDRQIRPEKEKEWETVQAGYVDSGWKDTVLIMPGESVKLLLRFEDFTGLYMYHCHNLEHEDLGMMRNYQVVT